jgi:hypothetical protein
MAELEHNQNFDLRILGLKDVNAECKIKSKEVSCKLGERYKMILGSST